jgi:hypothetical protein
MLKLEEGYNAMWSVKCQTNAASMLSIDQARNLYEAVARSFVPPKHWFTFNRLHSIIFSMTELFLTTAVSTSVLPNQEVQSVPFPPHGF